MIAIIKTSKTGSMNAVLFKSTGTTPSTLEKEIHSSDLQEISF